jgi:hypothetical protein
MHFKNIRITNFQAILILLFITLHSFLMNGYAHVNRYLTVGLYVNPIEARIDPTLFRNSLHVQSALKNKIRLSLIDSLSPQIFSNVDLETVSIFQWFFCLFLTNMALYYLGKTLTGSCLAGLGSVLLFCNKLNVWTFGAPAIYINFFHHGIQYAIMLNIFSLALVLRKKYYLAFLLMGFAWNLHPMSVIFLFFLMFAYWLFYRKEIGFKTILGCFFAFTVPALPIMIKSLKYVSRPWEYGTEWLTGVKWTVWFTLFPSMWPLESYFRVTLFFLLFLMGLYSLPWGEKKNDTKIFVGAIGGLCLIGTLFADVIPHPFVMKLSLWRSTWLYIILALPCIVHLFMRIWDESLAKRFLIVSTIILLTGYVPSFPLYYLVLFNAFLALFLFEDVLKRRWLRFDSVIPVVFMLSLILFVLYQKLYGQGVKTTVAVLGFTFLLLMFHKLIVKYFGFLKGSGSFVALALLFILLFDTGVLFYKGGPAIYYHGSVQGKRDPWADIQLIARKHSKKDDLFIVPPHCNDFGIYSKRATLGDWAEGSSILYQDNSYAKEWLERMSALGWKNMGEERGYNSLSTDEIVTAAKKYKVAYIVSEKPKRFDLPLVYSNSKYMLYKAPNYDGKNEY